MLYGYLISNTSNAKIGPLLYFTPSAEYLYSRLQSLLRKLRRKKKVVRHTQFLGFGKNIYIEMDSQKQLKLCRFPQRTCKLMRLKVVIWILIAARSWQWAVVARNKQNFTFISFNAGTVKKYTVTWIIFILPPWRESIIRYGRNREFTLILSVNSRLYGSLIHTYSIHEPTLFNAWIYAYSMLECTLVLRVNYHLYGCEPQPTAAIKIHITTFNRINLHVRCGNLHNFNCFWLSISVFFVLVKAILHL